MAKRFQMPFAQWTNFNSVIQAGAKLEFFESGTSTQLDTYTSESQATANANPVISDSAGQFPAIFLQARDYKVTLKNSIDGSLWTADPVIGGVEGTGGAVIPRGYIDGLTLSNAADTDHDIQVAAGIARDSTDTNTIELTSAVIKQIDVDWAEGTNAGGFPSLLTLSINTWYHFFVIFNTATNTVDAGFDTSLIAANLLNDATGYTFYRRAGSVLTDGSSNILGFTQVGDRFEWAVMFIERANFTPGVVSGVLNAIRTPPGIKTIARLMLGVRNPTLPQANFLVTDPDGEDRATASGVAQARSNAINLSGVGYAEVQTDTNQQIRERVVTTTDIIDLTLTGYTDRRGKDG